MFPLDDFDLSGRAEIHIPGLYDLYDLHDLHDLYDLYDLHVSWVGSVLYKRSCKASHNGSLGSR